MFSEYHICYKNLVDSDNDSIVSSSGYLCLAGGGEDVSGCVNAGDDEASRLASEDAPDSLLHLFLHHSLPLLHLLHHFLPFLSPSLFPTLCPQRQAKVLCLSPAHALFPHFFRARKRQASEWELGRSQEEQQGQGLVADERT